MMQMTSSTSRSVSELALLRNVPRVSIAAATLGEWIQILYGVSNRPRPATRSLNTFACSAVSSSSGISSMRLISVMAVGFRKKMRAPAERLRYSGKFRVKAKCLALLRFQVNLPHQRRDGREALAQALAGFLGRGHVDDGAVLLMEGARLGCLHGSPRGRVPARDDVTRQSGRTENAGPADRLVSAGKRFGHR